MCNDLILGGRVVCQVLPDFPLFAGLLREVGTLAAAMGLIIVDETAVCFAT